MNSPASTPAASGAASWPAGIPRGRRPLSAYTLRRYPGPQIKTTASVIGQRQIETFEAMCLANGRLPHELACDILLDAIRAAQHDHEIQEVVEAMREHAARLAGAAPARGRTS